MRARAVAGRSLIRIPAALAAWFLMAGASSPPPEKAKSTLPRGLDDYVTKHVKLTAEERATLGDGSPVAKLLDADETKEVAVFGAIWIAAPIRKYVEAVTDIENFERGGAFKITKRISSPPKLEDFAHLSVPEEDVEDLRTCRVGACKVKLGEEALRRVKGEVDWQGPNPRASVDAIMQRLALEYATGYVEGGNERLAVYRDSSRPTFVAREFRSMIDAMPELTTYMPEVQRYLLEFPKITVADGTSFLYWQETVFGLKPTIRISHLTVHQGPEQTIVTSKMLYASHYFWTGLELRALLPDPARGAGFWFVTVNRSRSDGLSGTVGFFVRGRVRSEVKDGALAALQTTKRKLEASR
jgi:hypothetical protein